MTKEQELELQQLADVLNKAADEYKEWKDLDDKLYAEDMQGTTEQIILLVKSHNWLKVWGELTPERQDFCREDFTGSAWDVLHQMVEQKKEAWWSTYGIYQDKHFDYCGWCAY